MFAALNVGLGMYLVFASTDPVEYRHTPDMFLLCQGFCILAAILAKSQGPDRHWPSQTIMSSTGFALIALIWIPMRTAIFSGQPKHPE